MNINSFSQNFSGPKIIIDSNGVEMLAFSVGELDIIDRMIIVGGLDKKRVKELRKKVFLLESKMNTQSSIMDSLDQQYKTCIQVNINKDGQIETRIKEISELNFAIKDYEDINTNNDKIIQEFKNIVESLKTKIKHKNRTITGLIVIDILIFIIILL